MNQRIWNRSLFIASLIAFAVCGISVWLELNSYSAFTLRLSVLMLALILSAACLSYSLRIFRFHVLLSQTGVPITLPGTAVAQGVGFALSIAPGSIGEVFKLHLIQQRTGTPFMRAAPALLLDRTMEGAGFLVLAFLSAAALPSLQNRLPGMSVLAVIFPLLVAYVLLRLGPSRIKGSLEALMSRWSIGRRLLPYFGELRRGLESSMRPRQLAAGLSLSLFARIADGFVLLFAAQMLGVSLALPVAIFVIASSGLAGGISLLPGGAGAAEATMAGLLMLSGAPWASALGITLLARMSTLWLWVGLGLATAFFLQLRPPLLQRANRSCSIP